jgi:NMD protein affecting ribosome stability and mRNA decay
MLIILNVKIHFTDSQHSTKNPEEDFKIFIVKREKEEGKEFYQMSKNHTTLIKF